MPSRPSSRAERRQGALSRERIVTTAVELLDVDGAEGLTFRALAARDSHDVRGFDQLMQRLPAYVAGQTHHVIQGQIPRVHP